jgi:hypothetical protein
LPDIKQLGFFGTFFVVSCLPTVFGSLSVYHPYLFFGILLDSITNKQAEPALDKVQEQQYMTATNNISTRSHERAKFHIMEQVQ